MKKFKTGERVIWQSQSFNQPKEGFYSHSDSDNNTHYVCEDKRLNGRLILVCDNLIKKVTNGSCNP